MPLQDLNGHQIKTMTHNIWISNPGNFNSSRFMTTVCFWTSSHLCKIVQCKTKAWFLFNSLQALHTTRGPSQQFDLLVFDFKTDLASLNYFTWQNCKYFQVFLRYYFKKLQLNKKGVFGFVSFYIQSLTPNRSELDRKGKRSEK